MINTGDRPAESASLEPMMEEAVFGREVELFLDEHPVGQYLVDRAKQDLETAHEKLVTCSPHDWAGIMALQLDARVALRIKGWLREAIESGHTAQVTLKQEADEHGRV